MLKSLHQFAGYYCTPEEKSGYGDEKILISMIAIALIATTIFLTYKTKPIWGKIIVAVLGVALSFVAYVFLTLIWIPWGC